MDIVKAINAIVAFALEIGMYSAYGMWGYSRGQTSVTRWGFAVGMLIVAVVAWSLFAAPGAPYMLARPGLYFLQLGLLLSATFLLFQLGYRQWAIAFTVLGFLSQTLALIFAQ